MITMDQVRAFAKALKTNDMTALREYLQYLFLSVLYSQLASSRIYFKGGTAIHLIYHAPRFSEDLDFTVMLPQKEFMKTIHDAFGYLTKHERLIFKERKTIAGKRYMMSTNDLPGYPPTFINLDFSFREDVLQPEKSVITSDFPIAFTGFIWHLSKEELYAEKIRAIMTRKKGRDLYDLWYLSTLGVRPDAVMVQKKLAYYQMNVENFDVILSRCRDFSVADFIADLRPFVPIEERAKLSDFYDYVQTYLKRVIGHGKK
ncbi:MAG: nucleotidyl transferase AbiEii/AbiGii toxin family protein [Candidatus Gottesmanbacteria bacterium]|nr:nucleotidyl transferase AbiEii/AbiGii toxin family protein [Candidatus Gottesmanbacteria bacterium]